MKLMPQGGHKIITAMYGFMIYVLPLSVILVTATLLFLRKYALLLLGSYAIVPIILAPIIYNYIKDVPSKKYHRDPQPGFLRILASVYYLLFSISILILYWYPVRTMGYYVIMATMYIIIFIEISYSEYSPAITLSQILLSHLNLIWGVTFKYPLFFGRTDIFPHLSWIEYLIKHGHITEFFDIYQYFPLWHILVAQTYLIARSFSQTYKTMFMINGIVYSFLLIFAFLLGRTILKNTKIAMLIALISSVYPDVIIYGMYSIPRSVGIFIIIVILYLIFKEKEHAPYKNIKWETLIIFISMSLVVYHTVSILFFLAILVLILIIQMVYSMEGIKIRYVKSGYLLGISLITIAYWAYLGKAVFASVVVDIMYFIHSWKLNSNIYFSQRNLYRSVLSEWYNYLQYSFILFLVIIGILFILYIHNKYKKLDARILTFAIMSLISSAISMPGPLMLFENFLYNLRITRMGSYLFIFIVFTAAFGIYHISNNSRSKLSKVISIFLIWFLVFFSISNDFTASDNPAVKRQIYTWYFTSNEISSFNMLHLVSTRIIMVDRPTTKYFSFIYPSLNMTIIQINPQGELLKKENNIVVLRISEINRGRGLEVYVTNEFKVNPPMSSRKYMRYVYFDKRSTMYYLSLEDVIYSSKDILIIM